jgi:hypothetical protein
MDTGIAVDRTCWARVIHPENVGDSGDYVLVDADKKEGHRRQNYQP